MIFRARQVTVVARLRRVVGAVAPLVVLAAGLVGCGEDAPEAVACEEGAAERWESCFWPSNKIVYCVLGPVRDYYEQGRLELGDLPEWAITDERNGVPIIYDIRAEDAPLAPSTAAGELQAAVEDQGLPPINLAQQAVCEDRVTEGDMRETEGGGAESTMWGESGE